MDIGVGPVVVGSVGEGVSVGVVGDRVKTLKMELFL